MVVIYIIIFLLILIAWFLVSPIVLNISSRDDLYEISWKTIANARLIVESNEPKIIVQILFWTKVFYPFRYRDKEKKEVSPVRKKKKKSTGPWKKKGIRLLRSFEVKAFRLILDTNNMIYNAYLYPIFYFLSKNNKQLGISYQGESELLLVVKNRPYRILLSLLF